ncbi:unnamed protein product [Spirodela intermedia]|uniref:VQ domain-containing protein n=1 Tax=Spirodela intermedia TaxID=51605 RepID=A0A7I8JUR9_SPIIN|nr:unnamed protein product [Spirodela intermedia]CAA6673202.1 unnamed protein product [Spirodela intermedia]
MGPPKKSGGWNRAAPLKVHHNSHLIHKHSPSPSSSSSSSSPSSSAGDQQQQPVIIYTSAPRIIHTPAKDFMRLVQKLTGLCPSDNGDDATTTAARRGPASRGRQPATASPTAAAAAAAAAADSSRCCRWPRSRRRFRCSGRRAAR